VTLALPPAPQFGEPISLRPTPEVLAFLATRRSTSAVTLAMGYGANWITDWYAYDPQANAILGLKGTEKVAGFMLMGTPREPALERERPEVSALVSRWREPAQG
jgi:nitroreductase